MFGLDLVFQLFYYQYPFVLPRSFLHYKSKYDLQVKLELLQSFSSLSLKKEIHIQKFIDQFAISNQKIKRIKKLFVMALKDLEEFIDPKFEITKTNGSVLKTNKITLQNMKQSRIISFNEAIHIPKLEIFLYQKGT